MFVNDFNGCIAVQSVITSVLSIQVIYQTLSSMKCYHHWKTVGFNLEQYQVLPSLDYICFHLK
jgi:hypothetical protein